MFVSCGFMCKCIGREDCDVWMPRPFEVSVVWSYGGCVGGALRNMLQCPMGSAVKVPYLLLCCVTCYVATIVSLEARYIKVRTVVAILGGLCRRRRRK